VNFHPSTEPKVDLERGWISWNRKEEKTSGKAILEMSAD